MTRKTVPPAVVGGEAVGDADIDPDLVVGVASWFVRSGRVVPGLSVDGDGRARSWWWPLPAASDRALIAALVPAANDLDAHRSAAERLTSEVDRQVRARLHEMNVDLVGRLGGRRAVPEVWLRSLAELHPWLPQNTAVAKVEALTAEITGWVSGALAGIGTVGVRLRVVEPGGSGGGAEPDGGWAIEVLVYDVDESSLVVTLPEALGSASPFSAAAPEAVLAALGRAVRVAPELAPVLDDAATGATPIDDEQLVTLLAERIGPLAEVGVPILVPSWWTKPPTARGARQGHGERRLGHVGGIRVRRHRPVPVGGGAGRRASHEGRPRCTRARRCGEAVAGARPRSVGRNPP